MNNHTPAGKPAYGKVMAVSLLLALAPAAPADFLPPQSPQSDGMRDIMLIYANTNGWRQVNFLPYVAYLDRQGKPRDWFYDAYLFMMFGGSPSGQTYIDGATDRRDWEFYLDETFGPNRELAALDATVDSVARALDTPAPRIPVIAMIPYPSVKQKDFGDVDGDGMTENLSDHAMRQKAVSWLMREFIARWKSRPFRHLDLWGFYWMNEGISSADEAIVKSTAAEIHALKYKFHWIPWFNAPGVTKWRELGFDLVIMQPNYAFIPPKGLRRVPDENRLTVAANMCRRLGMGIEMELNMGIDMDANREANVDPRDILNLTLYLDHGDDTLDGYQRGAVRAYYQGYNAIAGLCHSGDPTLRRLYDDLYQFHKGTYRRRRPYQPILAQDVRLTDGLWKTRPDSTAGTAVFSADRTRVTLPFQEPRLVDDVRVHFQCGDAPSAVRLKLKGPKNGGPYEDVATEDNVLLDEGCGGGFAILNCPTRIAREMMLELEIGANQQALIDEILLLPATHLLHGYSYEIGPGGSDPARCLTDGIVGGDDMAMWHSGRGEARFSLPDPWRAESLLVHFRRIEGRKFAPRASADFAGGVFAADQDGVARLPLHRTIQEFHLTLEDADAGAVAVDEIALLPAENLAADCAYTYEPAFVPTYPDSGNRELSDGALSTGFGDGKTVGWASWSGAGDVVATLDLGGGKDIDSIDVHAQGGGQAAIEFPERITASVSDDGKQWARAAEYRCSPRQKGNGGTGACLDWIRMATASAHGRFVRLTMTGKGWLMLSEIRVLSGGENVALSRPYALKPQPTGKGQYSDNANLLTDRYYQRAAGGWKACAGFNKADPTITLDLGAIRRIGSARIHVHGGGPGGVYFPAVISLSTSTDGKRWDAGGETNQHPAENGKTAVATFMGVDLEPREVRFVRFHAKRRGWIMMDEIEVFPAP